MVELIAKRYGTAIYQLAVENHQIDEVSKELAFIKEVFKTEVDFVQILNHPTIVKEEKIELVKSIFEGQISKDLIGLIVLVVTKSRQNYLVQIIEYCEAKIADYNHILEATITSANALSDVQQKAMKNQLEALTKKTVLATFSVDETLIGGAVVRIDDRILDNSIKGKLANMSKALLEA